MSNIEHLIDSAIEAKERKETFNNWIHFETTIINARNTHISLEEIWEIADWVYYTYRPYIEWKITQELEQDYGYKV